MKKYLNWDFLMTRYPAFFPAILLITSIVINVILQPNMFDPETLNGNMRVFLPLILLAIGQAIVLIGGGIDISVGGTVSIVNTILATQVGLDGTPELMWKYVFISLGVGLLAGAIKRLLYRPPAPAADHHHLRHQLPVCRFCPLHSAQSGRAASRRKSPRSTERLPPLGIPIGFYVIAIMLLIWVYVSSTRYGKFLFAVGGKAEAAYETAVPVTMVRFSTYVISGFMAALAGITITLLAGSGNAEIGGPMTLKAITAGRHRRAAP